MVKLFAVGRSENYVVVVTLLLKHSDAAVNWFNLHYHTSLAAKRVVVNLAVLVVGIVAQVVDMYLDEALLLGAQQNRLVDETFQHFWQNSDDVNSHDFLLHSWVMTHSG